MKVRSRREDILEVASNLIHENGYQNTSVDEIIAATGVYRASFYYHFPTKEQLGFEVLERRINQFLAWVKAVLAEPGNPIERFDRLFDAFEEHYRQTGAKAGCPFGNLACEMAPKHDAFRQRLHRLFRDLQSEYAQVFSPWRFKLQPGITPESLAEYVTVILEGAALLGKLDQDADTLVRANEHARRYIRSCFVDPSLYS